MISSYKFPLWMLKSQKYKKVMLFVDQSNVIRLNVTLNSMPIYLCLGVRVCM